MNATTPEPPQFPAGSFVANESDDLSRHEPWIEELERAPARLRETVSGLAPAQLDTKYRNWSIRQIVHHLADSHLNGYIRFKLALTEERPTIKPYDESRWSNLPDAHRLDIEPSLRVLDGVHARWAGLLRSISHEAYARSFYHPEYQESVPLWRHLSLYAWHGRHHTAQIEWVKHHRLRWSGAR